MARGFSTDADSHDDFKPQVGGWVWGVGGDGWTAAALQERVPTACERRGHAERQASSDGAHEPTLLAPTSQVKASSGSVDAAIEKDIGSHDVFIYMKASRGLPAGTVVLCWHPSATLGSCGRGLRLAAVGLPAALCPVPSAAARPHCAIPPVPCCPPLPRSPGAGRAAGPHVRLLKHGLRHPQPLRCACLLPGPCAACFQRWRAAARRGAATSHGAGLDSRCRAVVAAASSATWCSSWRWC